MTRIRLVAMLPWVMRSSRVPMTAPNCSATDSTSGEASIALASSTVMLGRLIRSRNDLPCERLTKLNFVTNIVVGPICRNRSLNDSSKPRSSAVTLTIEVMPMTTPRMVRAERSLLVRSVSTAIVRISARSPARSPETAMRRYS